MRITQEADYAIRICCVLAESREVTGAAEIAEFAAITQRFALKILRKLSERGIVRAVRGASGGYELVREKETLSVLEIIESIEGTLHISKCLGCEYECSRNPYKEKCKMHMAFESLNGILREKLGLVTVRMLTDESFAVEDVIAIINNLT